MLVVETSSGPVTFQVEYAITAQERAKGLMFRRSLPEKHGMLFDFGDERRITMWMRNTYISLDMLFAGEDGVIVHVAERTEPFSERVIGPERDARYVLEIKGGTARKLGIGPGDRMVVPEQ